MYTSNPVAVAAGKAPHRVAVEASAAARPPQKTRGGRGGWDIHRGVVAVVNRRSPHLEYVRKGGGKGVTASIFPRKTSKNSRGVRKTQKRFLRAPFAYVDPNGDFENEFLKKDEQKVREYMFPP